jgi:hypothetical protein
VKEPRSWPKSSLSRSVSGIAAQLIATNARPRREESSWIARAKSSLPVPLSPSRSTVASVAATRSTSARTVRIAGDSPTIGGNVFEVASAKRSDSRERVRRSIARRTSRRRRSGSTGLVMKSSAPCFMASTAVSMEPNAVMTRTGSVGSRAIAASSTARPSAPGSRQSVSTRSTFSPPRRRSTAWAPLPMPATVRPSALSISSSIERRESLSSTIRMRAMALRRG